MKYIVIIFLFLTVFIFSSKGYSQNIEEKYDSSYGVFHLNFKINSKGKFYYVDLVQVQCEKCSEQLIKDFRNHTKKSFQNIIRNYDTKKFKHDGN